MNAKVSLIIPMYNAAQYLRECLDSVTAQTMFADVEVLLIDDGSTDASPEICDTYAQSYANITAIHKENGGVSAARNTGLEQATGKYIAFADADDLLRPEMLEKLYDACEKAGVEMSFCAFDHPYPDKDVVITYPFRENMPLDKTYIRDEIADFMLRDSSLNALWNKLFLRSVIEDHAIRMTAGKKYAEDREFVLRFLAAAKRVCYTPYIGYYYRYVETGAIQKPRFDYGERIVLQYADDCEKFAALGIEQASFDKKAAGYIGEQIVGAISFAENKLQGSTRCRVLKSILTDDRLQELLARLWDEITARQSKFNLRLLRAMRRKSIFGVRSTFWMLRARVMLYRFLKGEK